MGIARAGLTLLLLIRAASAAEPQAGNEAKHQMEVGVSHYEAGRYAEAIKAFELAYRLSGKPALLFNIARAEAKLGHDEAAIAFLRRYLEERPDAPDAAAVLAEVEARERAIAGEKARAQAEKDAEEARKRAADLAAQAEKERERQKQAAAAAPAPAHKGVTAATLKDARHAGYGLVAAGPALIAIGIGMGVLAIQSANQVMGQPQNTEFGSCCTDLQSRGQAAATAGIMLDVVGGLAAATGVALIAFSFRYRPERR